MTTRNEMAVCMFRSRWK